jgi:hypothetical protein
MYCCIGVTSTPDGSVGVASRISAFGSATWISEMSVAMLVATVAGATLPSSSLVPMV